MALQNRPIANPVRVGSSSIHGGQISTALGRAPSIISQRTPMTVNPSPISGGPTVFNSGVVTYSPGIPGSTIGSGAPASGPTAILSRVTTGLFR